MHVDAVPHIARKPPRQMAHGEGLAQATLCRNGREEQHGSHGSKANVS